jgi:hypothetical protein
MGHGIDFCKVHLAKEKASNMQSNIATKHNQLYATTLIIVAVVITLSMLISMQQTT